MRSSNCKYVKKDNRNNKSAKAKKPVRASKAVSFIVTCFIVLAAAIIPSVALIQNVEAVSSKKLSAFSIGDTSVFKSVIEEDETKTAAEKKVKKSKKAKKAAKAEEEEIAEVFAEETYYSSALVYTDNVDYSYAPAHVELSDYDRTLVEGLVMGEAGTLGYEGAALVAQAIRDSMIESGTTSVEYIMYTYQYDASAYNTPSADVSAAVSYIFDYDGCAVQHRVLYFYAADMVSNAWHESQNFVTQYGNVRFFDRW